MPTESASCTLRRRQDKPTVRVPARTLSECAARYAAYVAQLELGLPTVTLDR